MRRVLCSFLLLLTSGFLTPGRAQNTFAPVGAEWWYYSAFYDPMSSLPSRVNSTFHVKSVAETVIDGIPCRKVVTEINSVANSWAWYEPYAEDYFFYDNTDTVFVYNKNFARFTPIYVFNVPEGDTVCLPVPPTFSPDLRINPISGDTSFCFVIDSIRIRQYDTAHLRTFYTRALTKRGINTGPLMAYPTYNWGGGMYVERIIGDFFPTPQLDCVDCYAFTYAPYGTLRCYSDGTYNLRMQPSCDALPPLGINTPQTARAILQLRPNPAGKQFTIVLDKPMAEDIHITITDVSGRVILQTVLRQKEQSMPVVSGAWADGLYLLKFQTGSRIFYDKVAIKNQPE